MSSPPLLSPTPKYHWKHRIAHQLKGNNGGGAVRRLFLVLGLAVLSTLFLTTVFVSKSPLERYCSAAPPAGYELHRKIPAPPDHLYPLPLSATLEQRLEAFRNAPGVGWEPADFVQWNLETCGHVTPNHNKDLIAKSSIIWAVMNSTSILHHRNEMADFLVDHKNRGSFETLVGQGRGIVFSAGNADTLSRVVITLKLIRTHYNSSLPAAIFHFPSERPDPNSDVVKDLEKLNCRLIEATGRDRDPTRTKNYHLKAQSIVEAPWAEVVYLDSDNLPAMDPALLFDAPNYKRLGIYFTPDYWKTSASNPIWHIIGVQCRDEWEQEAGQIVVDKRRNLDAMLLSLYMLTDWKFWFYFSDGDKDVFRFAMLALRKRWAVPGRYVGAGALPRGTASGEFCSHTMQQYDHAGRPAFVHYNLLKQIPSGVFRGFSWGRTKQVASFTSAQDQNRLLPDADVADTRPERYDLVPYPDLFVHQADDVEADMLANADDNGWAIQPAPPEVRRRATLERGVRPYFHGGVISALCIDLKWEDPMDNREKIMVNEGQGGEARARLVNRPNELGINWDKSPLEVVQWSEDNRLNEFEGRVYDLGFKPNGKGF